MLCADMIQVCWKNAAGKKQLAKALLEDISHSGACLQLESPIALGIEIYWETPKQRLAGMVRYCVYREIGYFVGVEFAQSSKWSKKAYKPQHLLDLARLLASSKR